jgi:hypothetical protein
VDEALPSVVIGAKTDTGDDALDVRVLVDGELLTERLEGRPLTVEPGGHVFRYEMAGATPIEAQVLIVEGQKDRILSIAFERQVPTPAPTPKGESAGPAKALAPAASGPRPARVLSYVVGGVGAVSLGSFAYFGIEGRSQASTLAQGCGATKSCTEAQVDPVRGQLIAADVSLGVAIVSFGAAAWLFFSRPSRTGTSASHGSPVQILGSVSARSGVMGAQWTF